MNELCTGDAQAGNTKESELFYIQNRGYCGNCLIWWREGGHGYTMDLNEAWKVGRDKAIEISTSRRGEDVMWPVSKIDAIASRHVNCERWRDEVAHEVVA